MNVNQQSQFLQVKKEFKRSREISAFFLIKHTNAKVSSHRVCMENRLAKKTQRLNGPAVISDFGVRRNSDK